jgi:hypothetical protein
VGYVKPDSALVRAATDLLSRHAAQPGGVCAACDGMSPCASARHAIEVRRAAGLPDAISASDPLAGMPGSGSDVLGGGPGDPDVLAGAPLGGSFGGGFGGNSSYGSGGAPSDNATPAMAGQSSAANSGPFAVRPVGLTKVPSDD